MQDDLPFNHTQEKYKGFLVNVYTDRSLERTLSFCIVTTEAAEGDENTRDRLANYMTTSTYPLRFHHLGFRPSVNLRNEPEKGVYTVGLNEFIIPNRQEEWLSEATRCIKEAIDKLQADSKQH